MFARFTAFLSLRALTVILVCAFVTVEGCQSVSKTAAPSSDPVEAAAESVRMTPLTFRVLLNEEKPNGRFEAGETISVTTEVTNRGDFVATGVVLHATGTPALIQGFPHSVMIGELQPSETKHVEMRGVIRAPDSAHEAELTLTVKADNAEATEQKQFLAEWRPRSEEPDAENGASRDVVVDPHRVGIVVALSKYREASVSPLPSAASAGQAMAEHFQKRVGVSADHLAVRTDEHALSDDLIELFEEWLPKHSSAKTDLFIFVTGRAAATPSGVLAILPYEAGPPSRRRLVSLRQIYDLLDRVPYNHAVIMMDLNVVSTGRLQPELSWVDLPGSLNERSAQLIGLYRGREGDRGEGAEPSPFTQELLQGLKGRADRDRDGTIDVGELCTHIGDQVPVLGKDRTSGDRYCLLSSTASKTLSRLPVTSIR